MDLKQMSKIELHCHLDGSMGVEITKQLLAEIGQQYESAELIPLLRAPQDCQSLAEYLKRFDLPIQCLQTKEGLFRSAYDLAVAASKENVKYLEVRFAPEFSTAQGLTIQDIIESVENGLAQARKETDIYTGILVCGMRHLPMENNLAMLKAAAELYGAGVVGCDIAGDEAAFPTALFREFFAVAKDIGMPYTIHSGEQGSVENVREAIELGAKRIGHGIAMGKDEELIKVCANKRIGVELCPTSNLQTKAVKTMQEYPFRKFFDAGILLSVNTDNRMVSGTDCTREWELLQNTYDIGEEAMKKIYQDSVETCFAPDEIKDILLKKW